MFFKTHYLRAFIAGVWTSL